MFNLLCVILCLECYFKLRGKVFLTLIILMENLKPSYLFEIIMGTITDPCIFYIFYLK